MPGASVQRRPQAWLAVLVLALSSACGAGQTKATDTPQTSHYQITTPSRDGIGKVYMGREISQVMGHLGAGWLERPERLREERTDLLVAALALREDDIVVDLGAGTGYFSFPLSAYVPDGAVLAVDIQPQMLAIIEQRMTEYGVDNVEPVLGSECDPQLGGRSVDLVLMVDAYHEFSCPREVMEAVVAALTDDGRVVLVEYRGEDPNVGIKPLHTMTLDQAEKEMAAVGLVLDSVSDVLPKQHLMTFVRGGPR